MRVAGGLGDRRLRAGPEACHDAELRRLRLGPRFQRMRCRDMELVRVSAAFDWGRRLPGRWVERELGLAVEQEDLFCHVNALASGLDAELEIARLVPASEEAGMLGDAPEARVHQVDGGGRAPGLHRGRAALR